MLAGFLLGIVHDRRLIREAQVKYRYFAAPPDHSSLTRIRQRWGAERFRTIFERTVKVCVAAKVAIGEVVHVDASLIRADVSWESLAARHIDAVTDANEAAESEKKTAKQANTRKSESPTLPRVAGMEQSAIEAVIPANAEPIPSPVPMHRFRYDAKHDTLKCPRGKMLKAGRAGMGGTLSIGQMEGANSTFCQADRVFLHRYDFNISI